MPSKNIIKIYVENGVYHIYNRGVEKRITFCDKEDYRVFLHYLKSYLMPPDQEQKFLPRGISRSLNSFSLYKEIELLVYCLMPNHFHLMMKQFTRDAIIEFMQRLSNAYVEYFNKKYDRVGPLFQGRYKAVLVDNEAFFLHLSRYIHRNPGEILEKPTPEELIKYSYSSYPDYLGKRNTPWVHKDEIMQYFSQAQKTSLQDFSSYQSFVEDYPEDSKEILGNLALD